MGRISSEQAFRDQLLKGAFPPLILWVGEEDHLKSEALSFLKTEASRQGLDLEVYSAGEDAPSEILGRAATPSLLGGKTLLVLTEVERCGLAERVFLKRYAASPLSEITVVLVASSGVDADEDFIQSLAQYAAVLEFPLLTGKDLTAWAKGKAKAFGLEFEEKALAGITAAFAGQLGGLSSEIEKLSLLRPEGGRISAQEMGETLGSTFWEAPQRISQAVKEGRLREALQAWEDQRLWGDRPENILASMFYEASNCPGAEESREALYHADLSLKTGAASEGVLLPLVIARIIHPALRIKEENRYG